MLDAPFQRFYVSWIDKIWVINCPYLIGAQSNKQHGPAERYSSEMYGKLQLRN
jgi:hypothetical protein